MGTYGHLWAPWEHKETHRHLRAPMDGTGTYGQQEEHTYTHGYLWAPMDGRGIYRYPPGPMGTYSHHSHLRMSLAPMEI